MPRARIIFDKEAIAMVEVPADSWKRAVAIFTKEPQTPSDWRECTAIGKLLQAGIQCLPALNATHDVRAVIGGLTLCVDIKTLYPSYPIRNAVYESDAARHKAYAEELIEKIDSEVAKEKGQGSICLFDLSYLLRGVSDDLIGALRASYPECIIMQYDIDDTQLHVECSSPRFSFHRGDWYH